MATLTWRGVTCDKIGMPIGFMILKRLAPFLCLFLWVSPVFSGGEVYQWTDSMGTIHFTDNPHSVPEYLRGSPDLTIRLDFDIGGGSSSEGEPSVTLTPPEITKMEPVWEPKAPEVFRSPEPRKAIPTVVDNSQHFTTIVVVNRIVRLRKKRRCCRGVFRPNFNDRRFVHPSVFNNGGSRQFIRPKLSQ